MDRSDALKLKPGDKLIWFKEMGRAKWKKIEVVFVSITEKQITFVQANGDISMSVFENFERVK